MKTLLFALSVFCTALSSAEVDPWKTTKNVFPFSYTAEFPIKQKGALIGTVIRTGLLTPRYYYDLYDANQTLQVRGVTRALSLGMFFPFAIEIDLYEKGNVIGAIQGGWITTARAKFFFYDLNGILVATGYLNDESANFLILSSKDNDLLAELNGKTYGDSCLWEMKFEKPIEGIDPRILQVFVGFVCDYQQSFLKPPKEIHHHHYNTESKSEKTFSKCFDPFSLIQDF